LFPLRRLVWLAGLRCKYSNSPPHGEAYRSSSWLAYSLKWELCVFC
jgi:hypothetical protein